MENKTCLADRVDFLISGALTGFLPTAIIAASDADPACTEVSHNWAAGAFKDAPSGAGGDLIQRGPLGEGQDFVVASVDG